ncbi:hypothetical protein DPV78_005354 [Talaromyces pinophilus]|jgi:hypothetical protein|nr:hypothetical protein DPV78_005354 [Talaromyces pinophilus]
MCLQGCLLTGLMGMEPAIHYTKRAGLDSCLEFQIEVQVACKEWEKSPRKELVKVAKTHIREDDLEECFSNLEADRLGYSWGVHVVGEASYHY